MARNFTLKKLLATNLMGKAFALNFDFNAGDPLNVNNRVTQDVANEELKLDLRGIDSTKLVKVDGQADFGTYTGARDCMDIVVLEADSPTLNQYSIIGININDTPYPPPSKPLAKILKWIRERLMGLDLALSAHSSFSASFIIKKFELVSSSGTYTIKVEMDSTSVSPLYKVATTAPVQLLNDMYRPANKVIVLKVETTTTPVANPLVFPATSFPESEFLGGISISVTDSNLSTLAQWQAMDTKKVIIEKF